MRDWTHGLLPQVHAQFSEAEIDYCVRCGADDHEAQVLPGEAYAYLLGLYLGDGSITVGRRGVCRMRVTLDSRYPGIIDECAAAMRAVLPANRVQVQDRRTSNCVDVGISSKRLPCLFPQHGSGVKHQRSISLVDWQQDLVREHLPALVRGLIHSDGCRFTNSVRVNGRNYQYTRYTFTNASADIRRIFCEACDKLGIEWRQMNARNVSVARRSSVELLDEFVGPKA